MCNELGVNSVIWTWKTWKIADFEQYLAKDFIDFHWFLMNLLSIWADFHSIFYKGLLRNFIDFLSILLSICYEFLWILGKDFIQFSLIFIQNVVILLSNFDHRPQIHYFKCGPLFGEFCQDLVDILANLSWFSFNFGGLNPNPLFLFLSHFFRIWVDIWSENRSIWFKFILIGFWAISRQLS